jgi:hypothetical protein
VELDRERPDGRCRPLTLPTFNLSRVYAGSEQVGELHEHSFSDPLAP